MHEQRDMLFVSHANPEDNDFARWLALQLAKEGYPVWCDLTQLLGGESFWDDAEEAIRTRTVKFVYVLSEASNEKDGPLRELQVAQGLARSLNLRDFVIPLRIDNLRSGDVTIELARTNFIPFEHAWAPGLAQLLEKLEQDNVPKNPSFSPDAVSSWWRSAFSADFRVVEEPDEYFSNWFPIRGLPDTIYYHTLTRSNIGKVEARSDLPFPAVQDDFISLLSFAKATDLEAHLGDNMSIAESDPRKLQDLLADNGPREFPKHLTEILRLAWENQLAARGLPSYELANKLKCFYFTQGPAAHDDKIHFAGVDGSSTWRNVVGYSTVGPTDNRHRRLWHFALSARPLRYPEPVFMLKPHVVFSDDGINLWDDKMRTAKARRSQCAQWWNDEWRDRTLAFVSWLTQGEQTFTVTLGSDVSCEVPVRPLTFTAAVSYLEPGPGELEQDLRDYAFEEDDFDKLPDTAPEQETEPNG